VRIAPTPAASPTAAGCQPAVESDRGVKLSVKTALHKSATSPDDLRLLVEVTNKGKKPVTAIVMICLGGAVSAPQNVPGVILPGDAGPTVITLKGDDPNVPYQVVASGFVITSAEIAAAQPDLEISANELHNPDSTHPTMWIGVKFTNKGDVPVEQVKIFVVLYQSNGDIRDIVNYGQQEIKLGKGESADAQLPLTGIRSLSGDYMVRIIGIGPGGEAAASPTP
jgi:hypothetical protein